MSFHRMALPRGEFGVVPKEYLDMKSELNLCFWSCILLGLLSLTGCAVPQRFWPQKDIVGSDMGAIPGERTVLIASRDTEYKRQLVAELQKLLSTEQISHNTIGIKQLEKADPTDYTAVIIINTCLAWGLDHDLITFLDRQKTTANIILLTTSGEGSWLPDKRGRDFDAMSGASVMANVENVAQELIARVQTKLERPVPTTEQ
jgi:hypothetical protein